MDLRYLQMYGKLDVTQKSLLKVFQSPWRPLEAVMGLSCPRNGLGSQVALSLLQFGLRSIAVYTFLGVSSMEHYNRTYF